MADDLKNLEQYKLNLEQEKLDFEIRRFEADQVRRQFETAKLEEELRELRLPWYKKPTYLSPLALILVAIIGGTIAFGTDVFKSNVISLKKERDQLKSSVTALDVAKRQLSDNNKSLRLESGALSKEIVIRTREKEKLAKEKGKLQVVAYEAQRKSERLGHEIMLVELKTNLRILQKVGTLERSNPSLENVIAIAERNIGNWAIISTLEQAHKDSDSFPALKTALCLALYKATNLPSWKTQLKESSLDHAIEAMGPISSSLSLPAMNLAELGWLRSQSIYLSLLREKSVFTLGERVQVLKALYDAAQHRRQSTVWAEDLFYITLHWDEDATVASRDLWFEHLHRLHDLREWDPMSRSISLNGPKLLRFSPQAFGILLSETLTSGEGTEWSYKVLGVNISDPLLSFKCYEVFPISFPLKEDCKAMTSKITSNIVINEARIPEYRKWVNENNKLVSFWTDLSFSKLRSCSDEVMRRMIRGDWIEISDLNTSK